MTAQTKRIGAWLVAGSALAIGGVLGARKLLGAGGGDAKSAEPRSRWRSVTINRTPEDVMPSGVIPSPVAELGDRVDVEVKVAPGDKGTELRVRLRSPEPAGLKGLVTRAAGHDPRQQVRSALREAKQLIEVGEVLKLDPVPHGKRTRTPAGKLVDLASKRAPGEGVL